MRTNTAKTKTASQTKTAPQKTCPQTENEIKEFERQLPVQRCNPVLHRERVSDLINDPYLGTNELAAFIGRHPLSIYRYLRTNPDFPVPIRIGSRLAWRLSEVKAYVASRPRRQQRANAIERTDDPQTRKVHFG